MKRPDGYLTIHRMKGKSPSQRRSSFFGVVIVLTAIVGAIYVFTR